MIGVQCAERCVFEAIEIWLEALRQLDPHLLLEYKLHVLVLDSQSKNDFGAAAQHTFGATLRRNPPTFWP